MRSGPGGVGGPNHAVAPPSFEPDAKLTKRYSGPSALLERAMSFSELATMKAWMVAHKRCQPIEYHACDAVLTLWLMGWMGAPAFMLLDEPWAVLACVGLFFAPAGYVRLRRHLHARQRLRCDWLDALAHPAPRHPVA